MKIFWIISLAFITLYSCGSNSSGNNDSANSVTDSSGLTNPIAIDTVKHPTGMDNSSVISTDTAAMNTSNTYKKADSIANKKNR